MAEDGSIYVCFLCEKEFRHVSLLGEHMKTHGSVPDMAPQLPSRRGPRGGKTKVPTRALPVGNASNVRIPNGSSKNVQSSIAIECSNSNSVLGPRNIGSVSQEKDTKKKEKDTKKKEKDTKKKEKDTKKKEKDTKKNVRATDGKCTENNISRLVSDNVRNDFSRNKTKVKTENSSESPTELKVDPDLKKDTLTQRAMRLKQYIISREESSSNRKRDLEDDDEDEIDDAYAGPQESIIMVDSSFFSSGTSSKTPIGPAIINSEPEGFVCTVPHASYSADYISQIKRKKNSFMSRGQSSASDDILHNDNDDTELSFLGDSFTTEIHTTSTLKLKFGRRGRGSGRGRRGRPPLRRIKVESFDESSEESSSVFELPGRRSKPRYSEEEDEVECHECFKKFRSYTTMKTHAKSHSLDKEIHCLYCDEVFPQRYILYEHLVNDHKSASLTCPICKKVFTRPDSLKSHMVRMHEENGGLNCFVCGKNFPSQGQLEMHVRVHTGERPFKCDLCGKGFVQKIHLRTHLRTMHNVTDMPTTPCRLCEAKFDGRATLRDHYTTVHDVTTAEYKLQIAKLRREGKIPEMLPPKVKVVDPSFRYHSVPVADLETNTPSCDNDDSETADTSSSQDIEDSVNMVTKGRKNIVLTHKRGRKVKVKPNNDGNARTPGMGTVMNLFAEEEMFSPFSFEVDQHPKGRDQEELNLVESAFKVAEEMDQLGETSSTMLVSLPDSSTSGVYYSVPVVLSTSASLPLVTEESSQEKVNSNTSVMNNQLGSLNTDEVDDEYAQFAAEHAHIDGADVFEMDSDAVASRGSIVKAEPLEIFSGSVESTQAVEMLTM